MQGPRTKAAVTLDDAVEDSLNAKQWHGSANSPAKTAAHIEFRVRVVSQMVRHGTPVAIAMNAIERT